MKHTMNGKYILDGHTPVPCKSLMRWSKWFETASRVVKQTSHGGVKVSTVFLGLDHQFGEGPPILFETMVFGGKNDEYVERYATWEEAEQGHARVCKRVFKQKK